MLLAGCFDFVDPSAERGDTEGLYLGWLWRDDDGGFGKATNKGLRHSIHDLRRFEHGSQRYVCPQGSITGALSVKLNSSKQIVQWSENGAGALADLSIMRLSFFDPIPLH